MLRTAPDREGSDVTPCAPRRACAAHVGPARSSLDGGHAIRHGDAILPDWRGKRRVWPQVGIQASAGAMVIVARNEPSHVCGMTCLNDRTERTFIL
jgi:hypothetical protein